MNLSDSPSSTLLPTFNQNESNTPFNESPNDIIKTDRYTIARHFSILCQLAIIFKGASYAFIVIVTLVILGFRCCC